MMEAVGVTKYSSLPSQSATTSSPCWPYRRFFSNTFMQHPCSCGFRLLLRRVENSTLNLIPPHRPPFTHPPAEHLKPRAGTHFLNEHRHGLRLGAVLHAVVFNPTLDVAW